MNCKEFLAEVLASPMCPDDFENTYQDFQRYQRLAINTLNEFHRVCEKNNIPYQLAFGSLLGAVRDGGQVPWDYDVDVWVPYDEIPELIDALQKDMSKDYYFYCPETDPHCRHYMMRIAPKGYRTEVLHLDVFYMVGAPENEEERLKFARKVRKVFHTRYYKLVNITENYQGRIRHFIKLSLKKMQYMFFPVKSLDKQYIHLCSEYPFGTAKYCMSFEDKVVSFPKDEFWDTKLISTDCGTFRVTKNPEKCLKVLYGDYEYIYPLENRLREFMSHYKQLKEIAKSNN